MSGPHWRRIEQCLGYIAPILKNAKDFIDAFPQHLVATSKEAYLQQVDDFEATWFDAERKFKGNYYNLTTWKEINEKAKRLSDTREQLIDSRVGILNGIQDLITGLFNRLRTIQELTPVQATYNLFQNLIATDRRRMEKGMVFEKPNVCYDVENGEKTKLWDQLLDAGTRIRIRRSLRREIMRYLPIPLQSCVQCLSKATLVCSHCDLQFCSLECAQE